MIKDQKIDPTKMEQDYHIRTWGSFCKGYKVQQDSTRFFYAFDRKNNFLYNSKFFGSSPISRSHLKTPEV